MIKYSSWIISSYFINTILYVFFIPLLNIALANKRIIDTIYAFYVSIIIIMLVLLLDNALFFLMNTTLFYLINTLFLSEFIAFI